MYIFEFNSKAYQQKSGTTLGTKFAPPYARIFMDQVEKKFLKSQSKKPLILVEIHRCLFYMKVTASATKSSHQDRGPCYLHLPNFLYKNSPLLPENIKLL